MASMFGEVAADDAAMSEIRTVVAINIASNPVVTVELAAINIALMVVKVAGPALLIVERAALRLCVPETSSALISRKNHLTSAHHD